MGAFETLPILFVNDDATGNNDGSNWTHAFRDLQRALVDPSPGTEIWVAAGRYVPGPNETDTFLLKSTVEMWGGFEGRPGTESDFNSRDIDAFVAVLSGDIGGNDPTDSKGVVTSSKNIIGPNSNHVVTGSLAGETAILNGFTITAGQADNASPSVVCGGGMLIESGRPTLSNLTFVGNSGQQGGGMACDNGSTPHLSNILFSKNVAIDFGGGLLISNGSNPVLRRLTFDNNEARNGGGMCNLGNSNPVLANSIFRGNSATNGGGMYNDESSPTLLGNEFSGNVALSDGGAMFNDKSGPTMTNATLSGNTARNGGGIANYDESSLSVQNSIVWGNSAAEVGEQIFNEDSNSFPTVRYSLVAGSGGSGPGWDGAFGLDGGGNVDSNPLFVRDPDDGGDGFGVGNNDDFGDLRLQMVSPAIDAGDSSVIPVIFMLDLAGRSRLFDILSVPDTGIGPPPGVDMGAWEFFPLPPTPTPTATSPPTGTQTRTKTSTRTPTTTRTPTHTASGTQTNTPPFTKTPTPSNSATPTRTSPPLPSALNPVTLLALLRDHHEGRTSITQGNLFARAITWYDEGRYGGRRVSIDLDRSLPGLQSVLNLAGENGTLVEGRVVFEGEAEDLVSDADIKLRVVDEHGVQPIQSNASSITQGEIQLISGNPTEFIDAGNIRYTALRALSEQVGEDGSITLFDFDVTFQTVAGQEIHISFVPSSEDNGIGVRVNSTNWDVGISGANIADELFINTANVLRE